MVTTSHWAGEIRRGALRLGLRLLEEARPMLSRSTTITPPDKQDDAPPGSSATALIRGPSVVGKLSLVGVVQDDVVDDVEQPLAVTLQPSLWGHRF
jgi:hypothetical protein